MAKTPKRKWPDHPLVGLKTTFRKDGVESPVEVVDVMAGPLLVDTSTFNRPEAKIIGTIRLRLKHIGSDAEFWSPPMEWDGKTGAQKNVEDEEVADGLPAPIQSDL